MGNTNTANFQTYGCPIDRSSGNQAYLMAIQVQYAKIRAAISAQSDPIKNWLIYAYGPDVEAMAKQEKQAHIAATVTQEAFNGEKAAKMPRLAKIAYIAVLDYRIGQVMGKELPVTAYLEHTGTSQANWARDMEPYRRKALMRLKAYDTDGIANVSRTVKAIRESEECS
jgi:hypothetical protein